MIAAALSVLFLTFTVNCSQIFLAIKFAILLQNCYLIACQRVEKVSFSNMTRLNYIANSNSSKMIEMRKL